MKKKEPTLKVGDAVITTGHPPYRSGTITKIANYIERGLSRPYAHIKLDISNPTWPYKYDYRFLNVLKLLKCEYKIYLKKGETL